jgi:hypothetical protein
MTVNSRGYNPLYSAWRCNQVISTPPPLSRGGRLDVLQKIAAVFIEKPLSSRAEYGVQRRKFWQLSIVIGKNFVPKKTQKTQRKSLCVLCVFMTEFLWYFL